MKSSKVFLVLGLIHYKKRVCLVRTLCRGERVNIDTTERSAITLMMDVRGRSYLLHRTPIFSVTNVFTSNVMFTVDVGVWLNMCSSVTRPQAGFVLDQTQKTHQTNIFRVCSIRSTVDHVASAPSDCHKIGITFRETNTLTHQSCQAPQYNCQTGICQLLTDF